MTFRSFTDRDGMTWEIRPAGRGEWEFAPTGENRGRPRSVAAPGYEKDPYELSREELQELFDRSAAPAARNVKNPFKD